MDSRDKLRQFRRDEEAAHAVRLANTPREIGAELIIPGLGLRRLQLVYVPSSDPGYAWGIRDPRGSLHLYQSEAICAGRQLQAKGYSQLDTPGDRLKEYPDTAWSVQLPIGPTRSNLGGLDGETWQLALCGDLHSRVRLEWWSKPPEQWQPLTALAAAMNEAFLRLSPA